MSDKSPNSESFEAGWQARFDRFAARGGSLAKISGWSEHGLKWRLKRVMEAVDRHTPLAEAPVLDLGCGTGVYCHHLAESGHRPVGADYSRGMLTRAREVLTADAVPLLAADVLRLPFRDRAFGGITNVGVMQHIEAGDAALAEMARVTQPGALVCIVTLNRLSLQALLSGGLEFLRAWLKGRLVPHRHAVRRSARQLSRMAEDAGFDVIDVRGVYAQPKPLRFTEKLLDMLDGVKCPLSRRPVLLPMANAYLLALRRR